MVHSGSDRSLEVLVLAGRGLSSAVPFGGRRKVQITLVSSKDPHGEAFGAKVSPWTEAARGRALRFGMYGDGLKCSFPIGRRGGPTSLLADPNFADTAELRVRLLASQVSTKNSMFKTAAALLPTAVMDYASQEIDETSAKVEAEVKVPLANILSGRVGHAADRALGGWVPLRSCLDEDESPLVGKDEIPPALWMQMYVLPDHEALVSQLQAQLVAEVDRQPKLPAPQQAPARPVPKAKPAGAAAARWGPGQQGAGTAQTQVVDDLIDVNLTDSHDQPAPNLLDDLNLMSLCEPSSASGGGLPTVGGSSPLGLPVASGFGFSPGGAQGYAASQPAMAPTASGGSSAFGFIASEGAQLDLAALYASSEPPKAKPQQASTSNYYQLHLDMKSDTAARPKAASAAESSFASLESSILADLKL